MEQRTDDECDDDECDDDICQCGGITVPDESFRIYGVLILSDGMICHAAYILHDQMVIKTRYRCCDNLGYTIHFNDKSHGTFRSCYPRVICSGRGRDHDHSISLSMNDNHNIFDIRIIADGIEQTVEWNTFENPTLSILFPCDLADVSLMINPRSSPLAVPRVIVWKDSSDPER